MLGSWHCSWWLASLFSIKERNISTTRRRGERIRCINDKDENISKLGTWPCTRLYLLLPILLVEFFILQFNKVYSSICCRLIRLLSWTQQNLSAKALFLLTVLLVKLILILMQIRVRLFFCLWLQLLFSVLLLLLLIARVLWCTFRLGPTATWASILISGRKKIAALWDVTFLCKTNEWSQYLDGCLCL